MKLENGLNKVVDDVIQNKTKNKQDAHQLVRQAKRRATKIRPKAVGSGTFGRFANFDRYRSEAAGDVISGVAVC